MNYPNMYLMLADGTFSQQAQNIDVAVDVRMITSSVSGAARWGQIIGTIGMTDCVGVFYCNRSGGMLFHHLCNDPLPPAPAPFDSQDTNVFALSGSQYNSRRGPLSGRSDYAFHLDPDKGLSIYASQYLGRDPAPPGAPIPSRVALSGSAEMYSEIDWEAHKVPKT